MSPALGSRLSNDSIRKREATMKANARASRLALAERVREACAEAAREHSCMTYSELCDCGGKIAKNIRALDLSKLVEGE